MRLSLIIRRPADSCWFYWFAITEDSRCRMIGRRDELDPARGMLSPAEALARAIRVPWSRVMQSPEWVAEVRGMGI